MVCEGEWVAGVGTRGMGGWKDHLHGVVDEGRVITGCRMVEVSD